jgi:signal transduction histidine kinase
MNALAQDNQMNMCNPWSMQSSLDRHGADDSAQADEAEAVLRHDMVNCITSMHLQIELLRRKQVLDENQSRVLLDYVVRMETLMQDWRQLGRDQVPVKADSVFNLSDVILNVVEANRAYVILNEQSLTMYIDPSAAMMRGDQSQIQRALDNLISNAMKYTPRGGAVLVSMVVEDNKALIIIADTGIGIPVDEAQYVFKPFFRARNALSNQISGTGLGLSQVKEAIEVHGGTIMLHSKYNVGTQVNVYLPLTVEKG